MAKRDKLTVEIFRDKDTPSMSIDPVIVGVESLMKITDRLDVAEATQTVEFQKSDDNIIDTTLLLDPGRADINVFVTGSPFDLTNESGHRLLGFAHSLPSARSLIGYRTAVISLYKNKNASLTAAHEIAHTLNVKEFGYKSDEQGHCVDPCCTMFSEAQSSELKERVANMMYRSIGKITRSPFVVETTNGFFSTKTFCADCIEETNGNADALIDTLHGKSVGSQRVFPTYIRNLMDMDG